MYPYEKREEFLKHLEEMRTPPRVDVIERTVVQRTALMPYYSVMILFQMYNSKVALTANDKASRIMNIPGFVDTGIMIVEKDQAKSFIRKK